MLIPTLISAKVGTCSGVVLNYQVVQNYQNNRLTSKLHNNRDNYIDIITLFIIDNRIVLEKRGLIFFSTFGVPRYSSVSINGEISKGHTQQMSRDM